MRLVAALGFAFLLFPSAVFAQRTDNPIRDLVQDKIQQRQDKVENRQDARQEKKDERRDKVAERRNKIEEKRADRIKEFILRAVRRLSSMVERLEKLVDRIQSKIDKFTQRGVDTKEAQNQLDSAKSKLSEVKQDIASLSGIADQVVSSDNPKESFAILREKLASIKKKLVEVHRNLSSSMGKIKGLSSLAPRGQDKQATEGGTKDE